MGIPGSAATGNQRGGVYQYTDAAVEKRSICFLSFLWLIASFGVLSIFHSGINASAPFHSSSINTLMLRLGETVFFSKGTEKNVKITTIDDLEVFNDCIGYHFFRNKRTDSVMNQNYIKINVTEDVEMFRGLYRMKHPEENI